MCLGMFKQVKMLLDPAILEANAVGQRYYQFAMSSYYVQIQCFGIEMRAAGQRAERMLSLHRHGDDELALQWRYWSLVHGAFYLLLVGGEKELQQSVKLGEEAVFSFGREGDIHVQALAWLGEYDRAADMTIAMLEDRRLQRRPTQPGAHLIYLPPLLAFAHLLCVGRELAWGGEQKGGGGGDAEVSAEDPSFSFYRPKTRPLQEKVKKLKELSGKAVAIGARVVSLLPWSAPDVAMGKALITWGFGGSALSSATALKLAAQTAGEVRRELGELFFFGSVSLTVPPLMTASLLPSPSLSLLSFLLPSSECSLQRLWLTSTAQSCCEYDSSQERVHDLLPYCTHDNCWLTGTRAAPTARRWTRSSDSRSAPRTPSQLLQARWQTSGLGWRSGAQTTSPRSSLRSKETRWRALWQG